MCASVFAFFMYLWISCYFGTYKVLLCIWVISVGIIFEWWGWVLLNAFVFSVSSSTGGVRIWMCEIVQGEQEEEIRREPRVSMWGWHSMDRHKPYILCALWYIGRHCWRIARIWWWIHSWPSSSWDWSHPSGMAILIFLVSRLGSPIGIWLRREQHSPWEANTWIERGW